REVVAKRVRARVRIEADGRRDPRQQVVSGDHHVSGEEADVSVRVAGKLPDAPAVDHVACLELLGIARVADEGPQRVARLPEVAGDVGWGAVEREPALELRAP